MREACKDIFFVRYVIDSLRGSRDWGYFELGILHTPRIHSVEGTSVVEAHHKIDNFLMFCQTDTLLRTPVEEA
jgi:hypothetical protein